MNVLPWYKHLLIMHIFEKIMYLQDLFYQIRSSWSESESCIVIYNVKGNFSQQFSFLQYSCFAVCRFSLVNYARFWADYMTYSDACVWGNGMKLTDIGLHDNIKIYTEGNTFK